MEENQEAVSADQEQTPQPESQIKPAKRTTLRELLEAGIHLGHRAKRWNPKMSCYIFGKRNGIHIIDLRQSLEQINKACDTVTNTVSKGGQVLFVGTKRQAVSIIEQEARRCKMHYVNLRWLGGTLTNYRTIRSTIDRMHSIEKMRTDGTFDGLIKKEKLKLEKEHTKLKKFVGGIGDMEKLPEVVFVVDMSKEIIAMAEARKLGITLISMADTNTDPELANIPIPCNDDAIRSIQLITSKIADACIEGTKQKRHIMKQPGIEGYSPDKKGPQVAKRPRWSGKENSQKQTK